MLLNEHARNTFTDIAFESKYGEADVRKKKKIINNMMHTYTHMHIYNYPFIPLLYFFFFFGLFLLFSFFSSLLFLFQHTSKRMYVSTASGSLFQINYHDRKLECIYKLHSGPIHSVSINEGFCITGSADHYLRVWPLDFSDFYLQAQHKCK